ncbi:unnamed protein product [Oppiella nova]|uniref:EB domain-containing protein n=1 Tax=Oppiella nova TaxID=334625 RepID=A0A7R9QP07_9ACAR|nr:unnamed protein product [Oppiella nova]CAG2170305.1 unnamed protein product [Oppiella nova]
MIGKKCLKSASLNNECKNRDQCTDNQTYCSDKNICECKSGYNLSGNKCIAIKSCDSSELGFNEHYIRGDCDQNEFCRNSVCLCLPNYMAQGDQCVNRDDGDRPWLERYGYYIIGGLAAFLVITVFLTVIQVKKRRQRKQNLRTQQNSKDPLNSVNTE